MIVVDGEAAAIVHVRSAAGDVVAVARRPHRPRLARVAAESVIGEGQDAPSLARRQHSAEQVVAEIDIRPAVLYF